MMSVFSALIAASMLAGLGAAGEDAKQVLDTAGVQGGLVVHLGCGDGQLTAALRADERLVVHGLDVAAENVAKAREHISKLGLYGPVSVALWRDPTRLPLANGLVNLLVVGDACQVDEDELMRVVAPGGVVLAEDGDGEWKKTVKPRPGDIDEWTHHLHDAGGNAVARDRQVGPPRHLRWTCGPLWQRSHGWTPSVTAMVSCGGRLFYILDETLTGADGSVPDQWTLTARDAFSGVLLWKRPVPNWGAPELGGAPGTGAGAGRFSMPPNAAKRLAAVGDTVYVTLGAQAPVTAIDAATGKTRKVYEGTERADAILIDGGRLIASINPPQRPEGPEADKSKGPPPAPGKRVCAVDLETGKVLWNVGPFTAIRATRIQDPCGRLELAAGDGRVFLLTHEAIETLDADSGEQAWRIERPALPDDAVRSIGFAGMFEFGLTVMVYHDGVVLLAQPEPNAAHSYHTMPGTLYAFDAKDGRQMWKREYGAWGHCTQPDVFVMDGQVWTHAHTPVEMKGKFPRDMEKKDYRIQALDLRTGELEQEWRTRDLFLVGHHHRCYRNRTTERYLMASRRGVEFVDLATGENFQNHWVRSGCLLGNLPCNGLLYVTSHHCGCYIDAKLTGFNALAPADKAQDTASTRERKSHLVRGLAYEKAASAKQRIPPEDDWPTFRHDPQRSGATDADVGKPDKIAWQTRIGRRPSAPVIAGGKVYVADVDAHTVHALDAGSGKRIWSFTAEARIDSPPTIHRGLALFGSADGRVYALRASDGGLAWRFDAAPADARIMAFGQLESPWPVPGSVLVHEGKCWLAAGRSSYLDGGIHIYALDPASGEVLHEETVYHPDPETGKMATTRDAHKLPGLLNDIPATDGARVFLRQRCISDAEGPRAAHLFSTAGYLDPTWFNRTFWSVGGKAKTTGQMVLGRDAAFGVEVYDDPVHRERIFKPGSGAYRLIRFPKKRGAQRWEKKLPIRPTAMIRAGDTIVLAGPPDVVDPDDPHAAWEGRKGGVLLGLSTEDGERRFERKLPAPPVWIGMAAAGGKLFLALSDGNVMCLKGK